MELINRKKEPKTIQKAKKVLSNFKLINTLSKGELILTFFIRKCLYP